MASTRLTPLRGELPGYRRRRDVAPLAPRPSAPTALFAFTYLEMTRGVDHEVALFDDARFAQRSFDAFDNWHADGMADYVRNRRPAAALCRTRPDLGHERTRQP